MSLYSTTGPAQRNRRGIGRLRRFDPWLLVLIVPGIALFLLFLVWPLISAVSNSFFRWDGLSPKVFVGIANYVRVFTSGDVGRVVLHTVVYAAGTATAKIVLAFVIALLVARAFRGVSIVRSVLFVPVLMSFVAVGILWSFVLDPNRGLLNETLGLVGLPANTAWLGAQFSALASIMGVDVWKWLGYHVILFVAGLQAVRPELYEAARVDGAKALTLFRHITIPSMRTMIALNFIIATGGALNVFDLIYIMTKGGPYGGTETVMTYMYHQAFAVQNFGVASALAATSFVGVAIITLAQVRLLRSDYTN